MNRVLGFKDPVLCDAFVCDSMGYSIQDVPYIPLAEKLGVGSTDTAHANMIYLNQPDQAGVKFRMTHRVQKLAAYTEPKDACSACYGSLIYALDRLNDAGYLRRGLPLPSDRVIRISRMDAPRSALAAAQSAAIRVLPDVRQKLRIL